MDGGPPCGDCESLRSSRHDGIQGRSDLRNAENLGSDAVWPSPRHLQVRRGRAPKGRISPAGSRGSGEQNRRREAPLISHLLLDIIFH